MTHGRRSYGWAVFVIAVCLWAALSYYLPPSFSGTDVAIFRDAGSNLAMSHRFVAPGLPYMEDLRPRLFAHYTPLTPLAYGAYASVFRVGVRTATWFWLLLSCVPGFFAIYLIRRTGLRSFPRNLAIGLILAVLPLFFFDTDRPEALGLIFFVLAIMAALGTAAWSWPIAYILVGATALAHPFAGILAACWVSIICLFKAIQKREAPSRIALRIVIGGSISVSMVAMVALEAWHLDPTSLSRFWSHAFGSSSGLGALRQHDGAKQNFAMHYASLIGHGIFSSKMHSESLFAVLAVSIVVVAFTLVRLLRKGSLSVIEKWVITGSLVTLLLPVVAFPAQNNYFLLAPVLCAFTCMAAASAFKSTELAKLGCLLFVAIGVFRAPQLAQNLLIRFEARSSFDRALAQPAQLLQALPSPDAIVAIDGAEYDLFKPQIRNIVDAHYFHTGENLSDVSGIVNCYDSLSGSLDSVRPLPKGLDPLNFKLVEPDPSHVLITIAGHRISNSQWGWGCDLYTRQKPLP